MSLRERDRLGGGRERWMMGISLEILREGRRILP